MLVFRPVWFGVVGALALLAAPASAQEIYLDRDGVWRYAAPPPMEGGPGPVDAPEGAWRSVVPEDGPGPDVRVLRPEVDPPEWRLRRVVPEYGDPASGAVDTTDLERALRRQGIGTGHLRSTDDAYGRSQSRYFRGERGVVREAPVTPDWSNAEPGGPDLRRLPETGAPLATGADDLAGTIARYAAGKRQALAAADPTQRLKSVRSANAFLVARAGGQVSVDAIMGLDTLLGLAPVTRDTAQLPGAGTEIVEPDARPSDADREAARRIAEYVDVRRQGEAREMAKDYLPGGGDAVDEKALAALDGFLGLDAGNLAATR